MAVEVEEGSGGVGLVEGGDEVVETGEGRCKRSGRLSSKEGILAGRVGRVVKRVNGKRARRRRRNGD